MTSVKKKQKLNSVIKELPETIIVIILSFVEKKDLKMIRLTSRFFNRLYLETILNNNRNIISLNPYVRVLEENLKLNPPFLNYYHFVKNWKMCIEKDEREFISFTLYNDNKEVNFEFEAVYIYKKGKDIKREVGLLNYFIGKKEFTFFESDDYNKRDGITFTRKYLGYVSLVESSNRIIFYLSLHHIKVVNFLEFIFFLCGKEGEYVSLEKDNGFKIFQRINFNQITDKF